MFSVSWSKRPKAYPSIYLSEKAGYGRTLANKDAPQGSYQSNHFLSSIAVSRGDSLYLVGKVLGHRQSRTTERYAYSRYDPRRGVADRTSERIAAIMQVSSGTNVVR